MKITVNKNANAVSFVIFAVLAVAAYLRLPDITRGKSSVIAWGAALLGSLLILFPHELLHAVCFKMMCISTLISSRVCCSLSARSR